MLYCVVGMVSVANEGLDDFIINVEKTIVAEFCDSDGKRSITC